MNEYVYELTLDLNCNKKPLIICSGQFDKGRKFEFTITSNGEIYNVTGCSAVLKGVRSDGSHFAVDCSVSGNKIVKIIDDTTLSVRGKTVAKLVLSDSTKAYSTQMFIIDVDSSLEGDITLSNDYSVLNRLIEQIHALNDTGAIIIDDTIDSSSSNAVANKAVAMGLEDKPDKATTLAGYGITDAYTKSEAQALIDGKESLTNKLDFFDTTTTGVSAYPTVNAVKKYLDDYYYTYDDTDGLLDAKADKSEVGFSSSVGFNAQSLPVILYSGTTIGAGGFTGNTEIVTAFLPKTVKKVQSGAFANCTSLTDVYINNTSGGITVQSGAIPSTATVHYVDTFEYVSLLLNGLYNAAQRLKTVEAQITALPNFDSGSGELTATADNIIKSANYTYQRVGNSVTVQIALTFYTYEQSASSTIRLNGLPFTCGNATPPRLLNITSAKNEVISAIAYSSSTLVLLFRQAVSFTEGETLSFATTYQIKV